MVKEDGAVGGVSVFHVYGALSVLAVRHTGGRATSILAVNSTALFYLMFTISLHNGWLPFNVCHQQH